MAYTNSNNFYALWDMQSLFVQWLHAGRDKTDKDVAGQNQFSDFSKILITG
jgi:hypothetical protein